VVGCGSLATIPNRLGLPTLATREFCAGAWSVALIVFVTRAGGASEMTRKRGRPRHWRWVGIRYAGDILVLYMVPTGFTGPANIQQHGVPMFLRYPDELRWTHYESGRPVEGLRFGRIKIVKQVLMGPPVPDRQRVEPQGQVVMDLDAFRRKRKVAHDERK
jgi:hypothetical protein